MVQPLSFPSLGQKLLARSDLQNTHYLLCSKSCPTTKSDLISMQEAFPKGVCKHFMDFYHCTVAEGGVVGGGWELARSCP